MGATGGMRLVCSISLCALLLALSPPQGGFAEAASADSSSYLSQARRLFDTGMEAHKQSKTYSSLMAKGEDERAVRMLRDSISEATGSFVRPSAFSTKTRPPLTFSPKLAGRSNSKL